MKVEELKPYLSNKNTSFEVSSSDGIKRYGKQTLANVTEMHDSLENYLSKVAKAQGTKQLGVQLYQKNGSSHLKKNFFMVEIEPVVASTSTVETPTKSVETSTIKPAKMEDIKTHLENVRMATELTFLKQQNDDLKERNKKLEAKNEELTGEVTKMSRDLGSINERKDLEYQKKELEILKGAKSGLGGVVEDIKSLPPEAWNLLGDLLGRGGKKETRNNKEIEEATIIDDKKHIDPDTQSTIEGAYKLLIDAEPEVVGMIAALVNYFVKYNDHLVIAFNKFFPDETKKAESKAEIEPGAAKSDMEEEELDEQI